MKIKYLAALAAASVLGVTTLTSCGPAAEEPAPDAAGEVAPDAAAEPCAAEPCAAEPEAAEPEAAPTTP